MRIPFDPGSRRPRPVAVDECAVLGRLVPTLDGRCRPTGALTKVPRALPVGLHRTICSRDEKEVIIVKLLTPLQTVPRCSAAG
jgi:hypothetical protein